ncbi:nectin precursor [Pelomyxa schiedti]|nr:nectin precursor [Pelomyxa schiedti]
MGRQTGTATPASSTSTTTSSASTASSPESSRPQVAVYPPSEPYPAIESGAVVTTSTEWDPSHRAERCRLGYKPREGAHAWCAGFNDSAQWLQVSFLAPRVLVSVVTQGRGDCNQYVTMYTLRYTVDGINWLAADNGRVFQGGGPCDDCKKHNLLAPVQGIAFRICPTSWNEHISMRCEFFVTTGGTPVQPLPPPGATPFPAIECGAHVTASTEWDPGHAAHRCRLGYTPREGAHAWCAAFNDPEQWLQVNFPFPKSLVAVATQGRGDCNQHVRAYTIKYTHDGINWVSAENGRAFVAGGPRHDVKRQELASPIEGIAFRICPVEWNEHISMRCEFYVL